MSTTDNTEALRDALMRAETGDYGEAVIDGEVFAGPMLRRGSAVLLEFALRDYRALRGLSGNIVSGLTRLTLTGADKDTPYAHWEKEA